MELLQPIWVTTSEEIMKIIYTIQETVDVIDYATTMSNSGQRKFINKGANDYKLTKKH